jgi:DNA-binding transcriptional LysR family regulator
MPIQRCCYAKNAYPAHMLDRLRAFFIVVQEGSVNRAAALLRISQPALSRQMQSLENEIGGKLLERDVTGVKPTTIGYTLLKSMRPILERFDAALAETRRHARGVRSELRIGYLITAAPSILTPALARFRKAHHTLKLCLHDMSPREQIDALRAGELDLALIGQEGASAARDFYSHKLCSFNIVAALSSSDPLANRKSIRLRDLKNHGFIGVDETEMPGRNRWITGTCRAAGFKPRFIAITDGITHVLSQVVSESAVTLLPGYFKTYTHPDIVFVPIADPDAKWDLITLCQRGKIPTSTQSLLAALGDTASAFR